MAATAPDLGTGATLTIGGLTGSWVLQLISFNLQFMREPVDTRHTGITIAPTAVGSSIPSRLAVARVSVEVNWIADNNPTEVGEVDSLVTFTFPNQGGGTGAKWEAQGFVTGVTVQGAVDQRITATMEIALNSAFVFTGDVG
jgi:hypothetical protein